jgi:solute:Na+ symporter, SSS family
MAICAPIIGLWYWCTDQYIVQRALGAPNETVARRGSIFAAFLKLFPPYLFIIPGLIAFALAKSGRNAGLADAFFGPNASPTAMQGAFPLMVEHLLPSGLRGIVVAGLLSALMGSLAGVFNACSTLFTVDLYQKWRPNATERDLVRTGRMATVIMVLIAMAWIPVIKGAHGLYNYLQAVQGYLAPPIFVVFFFGVFNKRLNALGCLWALIVGFVIGVFRLIVDTPVSLKLAGYENGYTYGGFLWIVNNIYFQYYSVLITVISIIVLVAVSYATAAPPEEKLAGLTYATITPEQRRQSRESWSTIDLVGSAVVVCAIIGAYLYFNG